jgi:alkaline phosphatase D
MNLIKATKAKNLIFLSGGRRIGAIAHTDIPGLGKVYDITSGPLNYSAQPGNAVQDSTYIKDAFTAANFGLMKINWNRRSVTAELRTLDNQVVNSVDIKF